MTIPNYITAADIIARLTPEAYSRWFSRATNGTVDSDFVTLCIGEACDDWNQMVGDALPGDWGAGDGVVSRIVKRHIVNLALYWAGAAVARVDASTGVSVNPFNAQREEAKAYAKELRQGHARKLITEAVTTPEPRGGAVFAGPDGNANDAYQTPFVQQANGSLPTGF